MTEHLSIRELEDYLSGKAMPDDLLRLDDHLAVCDECRKASAGMTPVGARIGSIASDYRAVASIDSDHLGFDQLAAYLDGDTDIEGVVAPHLAVCTDCTRELDELRVFKSAIEPPSIEVREVPLARKPIDAAMGIGRLRDVFGAWSPAWRGLAVTSALVMTIGAIAVLIWNSRRDWTHQGEVVVSSPGGSQASPSPAIRAEVTRPPVLIAVNDSGGPVTLDRDGKLGGLVGLSQTIEEVVRTALQKQTIDTSAIAGLRTQDGALMGGTEPDTEVYAVIGPFGRVVETDRPTFRWRPLADASSYTVRVFDASFSVAAESPAITSTTWQPVAALKRGNSYSWQVTALKNGVEVKSPRPPAPQARFKVLDNATTAELSRLRLARPQSHLALGVILAKAGLLEESERELRALLAINPESQVVRKLLDDVRAAQRAR